MLRPLVNTSEEELTISVTIVGAAMIVIAATIADMIADMIGTETADMIGTAIAALSGNGDTIATATVVTIGKGTAAMVIAVLAVAMADARREVVVVAGTTAAALRGRSEAVTALLPVTTGIAIVGEAIGKIADVTNAVQTDEMIEKTQAVIALTTWSARAMMIVQTAGTVTD